MEKNFKQFFVENKITEQKIYPPSEIFKIPIKNEFENILEINIVYKIFANKISFIYWDYEIYNSFKRSQYLIKKLDLNIESRVGKIDWEVNHKTNPSLFTLEQNKKILFSFVKGAKKRMRGDIKNSPKPNDILVSIPWDGSLFVHINHPENARKRSVLNYKFGFGKIDQYGYQYAKYDKNLNLQPI
jgi:hypothetical protein